MTDNHKLTRAEQAIAFHNKGYNCAQSVIFAFADQCNADPETLFKITEGLGLEWEEWTAPAEPSLPQRFSPAFSPALPI